MPRGIIDLIAENKRLFYKGEIRNYFYTEPFQFKEKRKKLTIINSIDQTNDQGSLWNNLKSFGQKFSQDLFYEPVK